MQLVYKNLPCLQNSRDPDNRSRLETNAKPSLASNKRRLPSFLSQTSFFLSLLKLQLQSRRARCGRSLFPKANKKLCPQSAALFIFPPLNAATQIRTILTDGAQTWFNRVCMRCFVAQMSWMMKGEERDWFYAMWGRGERLVVLGQQAMQVVLKVNRGEKSQCPSVSH